MRKQQEVKHVGKYAVFFKRWFDQYSQPNSQNQQVSTSQKQARKITQAINNQAVLLKVNSIFPFMLFPDSLAIDRQKVILTHRTFIAVENIINIQLTDLQSIEVKLGPLFGSICITTKQFENTVNEVNMLSRGDALKAQSLLQGFAVANEKKLDYSKIDNNQLVSMLQKLGRGEA